MCLAKKIGHKRKTSPHQQIQVEKVAQPTGAVSRTIAALHRWNEPPQIMTNFDCSLNQDRNFVCQTGPGEMGGLVVVRGLMRLEKQMWACGKGESFFVPVLIQKTTFITICGWASQLCDAVVVFDI